MFKLNDIFPEWTTGGIFSFLDTLDVPWKNIVTDEELDFEYHGNISGDKYISPLISKLVENGEVSDENKRKIVNMLFALNKKRWSALWDTLNFEYNPIDNYSMSETETVSDSTTYGKTQTRTDDITTEEDKTETRTPDLTKTTTQNTDETRDRGIYGFNSGEASDSDTETTHNGGTVTEDESGNETISRTGSETQTGTVTHEDGGSDTKTTLRTHSRSGNIGVTTTQQMIESERGLWMWNFFYDTVFPDVDRVFTLRIY